MIRIEDIIRMRASDETQRQAVDYAARSIHYTYDRMGYREEIGRRLTSIVVGIEVEQALTACFRHLNIDYQIIDRTHWRVQDKAEFTIGTRRVDVKSFHVYPIPGRVFPQWFMNVESLVPVDQLRRQNHADIYIQAFLVAPQLNHSGIHHYVSILPDNWTHRGQEPIGITIHKHRQDAHAVLVLAGEGPAGIRRNVVENHDCQRRLVFEAGHQENRLVDQFSSLEYVVCEGNAIPDDSFTITVSDGRTHEIKPVDWIDMWLDQPTVFVAGWGSIDDYGAGRLILAGGRTVIYNRTRTDNQAILTEELRPMRELKEHG